jgi:hypothetical protein
MLQEHRYRGEWQFRVFIVTLFALGLFGAVWVERHSAKANNGEQAITFPAHQVADPGSVPLQMHWECPMNTVAVEAWHPANRYEVDGNGGVIEIVPTEPVCIAR